jgi:ferredoxin
MSKVCLTIDGKNVDVPPGTTILEAAKSSAYASTFAISGSAGHQPAAFVWWRLRNGISGLVRLPAADGLVVYTHSKVQSPEIRQCSFPPIRKNADLHPEPEVRAAAARRRNGDSRSRFREKPKPPIYDSLPSIRGCDKCILCRRCVTVCQEIQQVGALSAQERGFDTYIGPAFGDELSGQHRPAAVYQRLPRGTLPRRITSRTFGRPSGPIGCRGPGHTTVQAAGENSVFPRSGDRKNADSARTGSLFVPLPPNLTIIRGQ